MTFFAGLTVVQQGQKQEASQLVRRVPEQLLTDHAGLSRFEHFLTLVTRVRPGTCRLEAEEVKS